MGIRIALLFLYAFFATQTFGQEGTIVRQGIKVIFRFLGKAEQTLADDEITQLAKLAAIKGGIKEVGEALAKKKLSEEVLADTYLRMAVKNNRLQSQEADEIFNSLAGTKGLATTARKVCSAMDTYKGHVFEMQLAKDIQKQGIKVLELGSKFDDGLKQGVTDIDLLLEFAGKKMAVECKNLNGAIKPDVLGKDIKTLQVYCGSDSKAIPLFCFRTHPGEYASKMLQSKKIDFFVGDSQQIAQQINFLARL